MTVCSSAPIIPLPLSVPGATVEDICVVGAAAEAEVPSPTGCGRLKGTCYTQSKSRVFSKSLTFFSIISSSVNFSIKVSCSHSC